MDFDPDVFVLFREAVDSSCTREIGLRAEDDDALRTSAGAGEECRSSLKTANVTPCLFDRFATGDVFFAFALLDHTSDDLERTGRAPTERGSGQDLPD